MSEVLYVLLKVFVLPPGLLLAVALCGALLSLRRPRAGLIMVAASLLGLWLLSMPWLVAQIARQVEYYPPLAEGALQTREAEAIVVLGGGSYQAAPEFNRYDDVSRLTLERLRYAARLQRLTGLDLAVSGGAPAATPVPEGVMMRAVLEGDFRVPVRWLEAASHNTAQNAQMSRAAFQFQSILLVTHAVHMPRAKHAFEEAGFKVTAAPMGYLSRPGGDYDWRDFLPEMKALTRMHYLMYELVGQLWYRCCQRA